MRGRTVTNVTSAPTSAASSTPSSTAAQEPSDPVDVLTVRTGTQLKDAARLLAEHRISGLPVVDDQGRVLGVLSEGDILYKEISTKDRPGFLERFLSVSATGLEVKFAARTVGEAMSAPAVTISPGRSRDGRRDHDDRRGG